MANPSPNFCTGGLKSANIWPLRRCGFETKQRIAYLFVNLYKFSDGRLTSQIWHKSVHQTLRKKVYKFIEIYP